MQVPGQGIDGIQACGQVVALQGGNVESGLNLIEYPLAGFLLPALTKGSEHFRVIIADQLASGLIANITVRVVQTGQGQLVVDHGTQAIVDYHRARRPAVHVPHYLFGRRVAQFPLAVLFFPQGDGVVLAVVDQLPVHQCIQQWNDSRIVLVGQLTDGRFFIVEAAAGQLIENLVDGGWCDDAVRLVGVHHVGA